MRRSILVLFAALCLAQTGEAAEPRARDWTTYHNDRFGVSLAYPAGIFAVERVSNAGDGVLLTSKDKDARLLVGAFANGERHSLASYQRFLANRSYAGFAVDYAPTGQRWFVLSGEGEGRIFYEKVVFSCGGAVINSFAMVYPAAERKRYDAIVEEMENSFRAEPGPEGCR